MRQLAASTTAGHSSRELGGPKVQCVNNYVLEVAIQSASLKHEFCHSQQSGQMQGMTKGLAVRRYLLHHAIHNGFELIFGQQVLLLKGPSLHLLQDG
jgi:hypothetical protein